MSCPHCADKDEIIAQLRHALAGQGEWHPPLELGLTPQQATILQTLMRWERPCSIAVLWDATRQGPGAIRDRDDPKADPENCMAVSVSRTRAILKRYGLDISVHWGAGYYLPPETRRALKNWSRAEEAA